MGLIFPAKPGAVVKLADPAMQCGVQLLGLNPTISYDLHRSIVTRVTVSQQVNIQFLHSLGSQIYVYVFGDRMGTVSLSGLSFACPCPLGAELGAEKMLQWYSQNRASKRRTPIRVTLGRVVIEGFVVGFSEDVVDASTSLVQFGVNIASLPEDN